MNTPVKIDQREEYELKLDRVKFSTSAGKDIEAKNVLLDRISRTLIYVQEKEIVSVDLSGITNLKYSDTNLVRFGEIFGGAVGLAIAVILTDGGSSNNRGEGTHSPVSTVWNGL